MGERIVVRASLLVVLVQLGACRPVAATADSSSHARPPSTTERVASTEVAPGERLLYLPEGDPVGLLGRAVTRGTNGLLEIAAERAPGCTVAITTVENTFSRRYESDLRDVAGFDADIRRIAHLQARHERHLFLQLSVDNEKMLRADLDGNCGERVITEVKIGRGSREVVVGRQSGGSAAVDLGPVARAQGGAQRVIAEQESLSWDTAQAWAFKIADGNGGRADVEIRMPEVLTAGEHVQPRIEIGKAVWLVVLYRDARGDHDVLLPRGQHPVVFAAGRDLRLPEMIASNLPGHEEDRETLLVFAFTQEEDFRQFKPPAGHVDTVRVNEYVTRLRERLDRGEIPRSRWSSAEFTYVIRAAP